MIHLLANFNEFENVTVAEFGAGDIIVSGFGGTKKDKPVVGVMLSNTDEGEVGREEKRKDTPATVLSFTSQESIDVLIRALKLCKEGLEEEEKNFCETIKKQQ